jgi:hypothetical protein
MSNGQSHRPRSHSRLTSRNRRKLLEKIPIPSFSSTPCNEENTNDANKFESLAASNNFKKVERVVVGKENESQITNIQCRAAGEENDSEAETKIESRKVADTDQQIVESMGDDSATVSSLLEQQVVGVGEQATDKITSIETANSVAKCSSSPQNYLNAPENKLVDLTKCINLPLPSNLNAPGSNTKHSNSSPESKCIASEIKLAESVTENVNHSNLSATETKIVHSDTNCNGIRQSTAQKRNNASVSSDVALVEPDAKSAMPQPLASAATERTTVLINGVKSDSSDKHSFGLKKQADMTAATSTGQDDSIYHKNEQSYHDQTGTLSEVEVIAAPPTSPKPKRLKSIESRTQDKNSSSKKLDSNQTKKKSVSVAKKKRKKPETSSKTKVEVIELDSDSDSSSSSSGDGLTRRHLPKKLAVPGKNPVKVEKKVKTEMKAISSNHANKSSKSTTQKSARGQTKFTTSSEGKKQCYACSTCKCNSRDGTSATQQKQATLSGSHARQERALINRLQKIERNVQWMESQKNDVGRQLMKHRNVMTKKWVQSNPMSLSDRPKFLADMDETGCVELNNEIDSDVVGQANVRLFGEAKGMWLLISSIVFCCHF